MKPRLAIAILGLLAVAVAVGARESKPAVRFPDSIQGITISTHGNGDDWSLVEPMRETFGAIDALGADWVAIHPYARIERDGTVSYWKRDGEMIADHVTVPIELAHERGLKMLVKPHLAYWGSGFQWRGEIGFDDPEATERFWTSYTDWIVRLAELSSEADGFVVGTELDRLLDADRWEALIARVRAVTDAPLTYAANWTDFERVPFWSSLDPASAPAGFASSAMLRDIQRC